MRSFRIAVIGVVLSLVACVVSLRPAQAQERIQTQSEMNTQAYDDFQKVDAELNRVYAKLIKRLDKEGVAKLKRSQRAWVAFRNAEMGFAEDASRGGSMMPLLRYGSGSQLTKNRTKELNQHLSAYTNR